MKRILSLLITGVMVSSAFAGNNNSVISERTLNIIGGASTAANIAGTLNKEAATPENEVSDFEKNRKSSVFEITYSAGTFDDVKLSGSYGFSYTILPWKIASRLYAGIHFSPLNFNYGLSDFNFDEIRLGPALGVYFTPKIFLSIPLNLLCDVYFDNNDNTKLAWGLSLAPAIYLGKKAGVFIGPQFKTGFSEGSTVTCGFRAGIYF